MIIFVLIHGGGGCLVQKNSRNGGQSELKLSGRSEKTFYVTSITHILQSIWSNFTKFLPHVCIQV